MEELDDDTLIALIKNGDTHAETLLCAKYWVFAQKLGSKIASLYLDLGLTVDEFTAVCFSSLVNAMEKYRPHREKKFKAYWSAIARNQCMNYVQDYTGIDGLDIRKISLDSYGYDDGLTLHETCGNIDHTIKYNISRKQFYDFIVSKESGLTEDERTVAYYVFLEGYGVDDFLMLTNWTATKIYHLISKARRKVSNFLKSGYFNK